jgi:hypothetical protein
MNYLFKLLIYFCLSTSILSAQPESYYSDIIAQQLDGITEHKVEGGRVDILTNEYAIEVKRASDWKHSIGQAIWYGLQTNKTPGIILIMKTHADYKYGIRLKTSLEYTNLSNIKVWFYPEDFGGSLSSSNYIEQSYISKLTNTQEDYNGCTYWINTGNKKKTRHNQSCRWYNNTKKGKCTSSREGNACGKCGG